MELSYPKVKRRPNGDYFVEFTRASKRFRLVNGNKIKLNLKPNATRRHINAFLNYLKENDFPIEISSLKPVKQIEKLHKPIDGVALLLEEIKEFNFNLFLY